MEVERYEDFNRIHYVDVFNDEVSKLFSKSKKDLINYTNFLYAELQKIDNREETIVREEPISYRGINFFSIRKRMKKNTRVLYYYMKDNNIILLTAFDEKRKSDYENAKMRAYDRLKELHII